jgi:adenosine deaminase
VNIELHTHLEGSVTPERLRILAERHGLPGLPGECLNQQGTAYVFSDFPGFLDVFHKVTLLLQTPADFHGIALDLGDQLARDGVEYAEVMLSYGVMLKRGLDPLQVQAALAEAAAEIEETRGVVVRWIPDAVRQWGLEKGWYAWEMAATAGRQLGVVGFGLGGDEASGPAGEFAELFAEVKSEGLGITIHAGEVTSMGHKAAAESVRQAVEECGANRIGHGLAAIGDDLLLATLAARDVFVELCPGSNVLTGALKSHCEHPVQKFLDAGVPCSLNTDDRTLFDSDLITEYKMARENLGLTPDQEELMQTAALKATFTR